MRPQKVVLPILISSSVVSPMVRRFVHPMGQKISSTVVVVLFSLVICNSENIVLRMVHKQAVWVVVLLIQMVHILCVRVLQYLEIYMETPRRVLLMNNV